MAVTLTPKLEAWIAARVADGEFASVEDGVRQIVEQRIAERDLEGDDLAWAKPFVDEGLADLEKGEIVSLEDFGSRTSALLSGRARK